MARVFYYNAPEVNGINQSLKKEYKSKPGAREMAYDVNIHLQISIQNFKGK